MSNIRMGCISPKEGVWKEVARRRGEGGWRNAGEK
jgi:hypothetical protein